MKCLICGNVVNEFENNGCLDSSGFVTIEFGYGSKFDCDEYEGHIHDSCFETISKNMKQTRDIEKFLKDWNKQ